jgi:hypothetical protein
MTNPTQSTWEQAILNKLTNNGERIAVVDNRLEGIEKRLTAIETTNEQIKSLLGWLKWISGGVIALLRTRVARPLFL